MWTPCCRRPKLKNGSGVLTDVSTANEAAPAKVVENGPGSTAIPAEERRGRIVNLPSVHFPTLALAAGISVFFYGLWLNERSGIEARLERVALRVESIPTRDELGTEIEQVAQIQRSSWEANAARVEASAREMESSVRSVQEQLRLLDANNRQVTTMLDARVSALDNRIAHLGTDFSGALIEYFRNSSGTGEAGGPEGMDEVYRDYAIRLVVRDDGVSLDEAVRFVDRAFLNIRGPEARRLTELAQQARARNRGVVSD